MESKSIVPSTMLDQDSLIAVYNHFSLELPFMREAASERWKVVVHVACGIPASTTVGGYREGMPAMTSTVLRVQSISSVKNTHSTYRRVPEYMG